MTRRCVVPGCKTGSYGDKTKRSVFRVPQNPERRKKWAKKISVQLKDSHVVCDKHFDDKDIFREWIKEDSAGKIIARVRYKHPKLSQLAVPTIFVDKSAGLIEQSSESVLSSPIKSPLIDLSAPFAHAETPEEPVAKCTETVSIGDHSYSKPCTSQFGSCSETVDTTTMNYPTTSSCNIEMPLESPVDMPVELLIVENNVPIPMEIADSESIDSSSVISLTQPLLIAAERVVKDPVLFPMVTSSECIPATTARSSAFQKYSSNLPEAWAIYESPPGKKLNFVFSYMITKINNGVDTPITQRSVTLDTDKNLEYFVYGRRVIAESTRLDRILDRDESLSELLTQFGRMNICNGIGNVNERYVPRDSAFQDYVQQWRDNECSMLSKKKRCDVCIRLRKRVLQQTARTKDRPTLNRFRVASDPVDQLKLASMRKKHRRDRRTVNRKKQQVRALTKELEEKADQIAAVKQKALDFKCAELNVPAAQRILLTEVIAAASKKDARGRRYTEEWMMLCMLMNIRSRGNYEFLRKNNVLPLPCSRTIRSYFSLFEMKCGFDAQFAKILEKQLASKTPLQRNGVLLLDEISVRKSIAVCSRDLTYVGVTDFGFDGPQSSDIRDQATHGLVLMFQSLADSYTQPIAVFASKNSVQGSELEKLVIKAICYLETCGAKIHGVIADGASTNAKMWKLLGITGTLENSKTWFTHPLDHQRKVFVFSDPPHLIKNIRNRLYNKQRLRTKSTENYISWEYFTHLFDRDKVHPGNARVCPKITKRHILPDSTSKMRVRLATQIFSNSVAHGLTFYRNHKCKEFIGCEETIDFCKRVNDMFDAMNCKSPNQGLTPNSEGFKVLEDSLQWLNDWESAKLKKDIAAEEFLTDETARGLRISLQSMMDMCRYLIKNFEFQYLLSGKVNQDNLEKFFGTIRQSAGSNDHPTCPTFLQLYKLLSVYSIIKPPKYGNCTVSDNTLPPLLVSLSDLKATLTNKEKSKYSEYLRTIKIKLDAILQHDEWEADDVIEYSLDHDHAYVLTPILDCVIYYVTGYLCKQVLKIFDSCTSCIAAVRSHSAVPSGVTQLVDLKSRGGLIHANFHFFRLIRYVESIFSKHCSRTNVFDLTLDEVLENYSFTFPCTKHASDILSYSIVYYIRLRMRQNAQQENLKMHKQFVVKNKLSKMTCQ